MPKLTVSMPHALGRDEALARLQQKVEKAVAKFSDQVSDLSHEWVEGVLKFAFSTYGMKVDGNVTVEDGQATVDANLPFAAMMFKGRIEKEIRSSLERWLT